MTKTALSVLTILMGLFTLSAQAGSVDPELCAERVHEFLEVQPSGGLEVLLALKGESGESRTCYLDVERRYSDQKLVTEFEFNPRAKNNGSVKDTLIARIEGDDRFVDRKVKKCELINDNELRLVISEENNVDWDRITTYELSLVRDSYGVKEVTINARSGYKFLPKKQVANHVCKF